LNSVCETKRTSDYEHHSVQAILKNIR